MRRDAATEAQVRAAAPGTSTWLSANAGSGKTRVLTNRVARLLLNGVMPQHVLCLTYTKAAASEMQNRLFRTLGEWAMKEDADLRQDLQALGVDGTLDAKTLRGARRLFARAIETPGGLKIQTIHAFCAAILRRFPLEAGVSPQFTEMDERTSYRLREEVLEQLALGPEQGTLDALAAHYTGDDIVKLTDQIAGERAFYGDSEPESALLSMLGLGALPETGGILSSVFLGGEAALINALVPILLAGSSNDQKLGKALAGVPLDTPCMASLLALESLLLLKSEPFAAKTSQPTKPTRAAAPELTEQLHQLSFRVEEARRARISRLTYDKSLSLHRFARAFLPLYQAAKDRRGWLDFDDLILKTRDLLSRPGVAEWVLYRLDGGIDHILVDEAQDTSPTQWQVIDLLAQEFTSGQGARPDTSRTIFVVGDKKQSIYSFQGADPAEFDRMQAHFDRQLGQVGAAFLPMQLEYSFRSSSAILSVVDQTFPPHNRQGMGETVLHRAFHTVLPGRVDLWPPIEKGPGPERPVWTDPIDTLPDTHHTVRLARRIAEDIQAMLARGETLRRADGSTRRITAGDILILVQRRSELFHEIIRACKTAGISVAGADRLKIGGELAVKDLTALLSFLATPEDDLSLACVLRSPLFGWSEARLYDLAHGRKERYLWAELRRRSIEFETEHALLQSLLSDADFLRPYELIERVLTRHGGRRKLIARLGEEAEDGIDALLSQALNYERTDVPSLTGFLVWFARDEVEIKRRPDSAGDRLRVMTVHGAKGLEAPVVILPDTGDRPLTLRDDFLTPPGGAPLWNMPKAESPEAVLTARAAGLEKEREERQRLLYVAMTRAEQWLIVCAAGAVKQSDCWYNRIAAAMDHAGAVDHGFPHGPGKRYQVGGWGEQADQAAQSPAAPTIALPDWAQRPAAIPPRPAQALAPSDLGGAKALPGEGREEAAAKAHGTAVHLLLEHLPALDPSERDSAGTALLPADTPDPRAALAEAQAVLAEPGLAFLFAAETLAEVPVSAEIAPLGGARISGIIDRLIIQPDRILAVDFKTNTQVPTRAEEVPEGLLRQMGAYADALAQIWPGMAVETAILWTARPALMALPSQLVALALARGAPS